MSRIRSVHPGFATDDRFIEVSRDARLFYLLLLTQCDDQGVFEWKPAKLKMNIFPADNIDISPLLAELTSIDAVCAYEIEGRKLGGVRNFRKYQRPKFPKAVHAITPDIGKYTCSTIQIPPIAADDDPPIPRFAEKSPQREEGGDKREEESRSDANASALPSDSPLDLKREIWRRGKALLGKLGISESKSGPLLGAWRRDFGDLPVLQALTAAEAEAPSDIVSFMAAVLARNANGKRAGKPSDDTLRDNLVGPLRTAVLDRRMAAGAPSPGGSARHGEIGGG